MCHLRLREQCILLVLTECAHQNDSKGNLLSSQLQFNDSIIDGLFLSEFFKSPTQGSAKSTTCV